jgi:hypothetical protein
MVYNHMKNSRSVEFTRQPTGRYPWMFRPLALLHGLWLLTYKYIPVFNWHCGDWISMNNGILLSFVRIATVTALKVVFTTFPPFTLGRFSGGLCQWICVLLCACLRADGLMAKRIT